MLSWLVAEAMQFEAGSNHHILILINKIKKQNKHIKELEEKPLWKRSTL